MHREEDQEPSPGAFQHLVGEERRTNKGDIETSSNEGQGNTSGILKKKIWKKCLKEKGVFTVLCQMLLLILPIPKLSLFLLMFAKNFKLEISLRMIIVKS